MRFRVKSGQIKTSGRWVEGQGLKSSVIIVWPERLLMPGLKWTKTLPVPEKPEAVSQNSSSPLLPPPTSPSVGFDHPRADESVCLESASDESPPAANPDNKSKKIVNYIFFPTFSYDGKQYNHSNTRC